MLIYMIFLFSGNNIWHLVLIFLGCGKYPRLFYSLLSVMGRKALNPGDVTVVLIFKVIIAQCLYLYCSCY